MAARGHMLLVSVAHPWIPYSSRAQGLRKLSELAFVGKDAATYLMLLAGSYYGQQLNKSTEVGQLSHYLTH